MYYMRFIDDDGSSEEKELQHGDIYCRCSFCCLEYAPSCIELDREPVSDQERTLRGLCPSCYSTMTDNQPYVKLAETLSHFFLRDITPAEVRRLLADCKSTGSDVWVSAKELFGVSGSSNVNQHRPQKPEIAQQAQPITIIPRHEPKV